MFTDKDGDDNQKVDTWRSRWYRRRDGVVLEEHMGPNTSGIYKNGRIHTVKVSYGKNT